MYVLDECRCVKFTARFGRLRGVEWVVFESMIFEVSVDEIDVRRRGR
jgi:hypothetical protein